MHVNMGKHLLHIFEITKTKYIGSKIREILDTLYLYIK